MNLRPLGDRVLIKPEVAPDQTESGLWLSEHRKPEQTGTVVAVGLCPHPLKHEAEGVAQELEERIGLRDLMGEVPAEDATGGPMREDWIAQLPDVRAANLLRQATAREPQVKPGDYVVFSWTAGQELTLENEERLLMMRESDILAVVEGI